MLNVIAMLLITSVVFLSAMNYMAENISDFESLPLPPKKEKKVNKYIPHYPVIKVDAKSRDKWTLVDFSTGKFHHVEDPEKVENLDWDMAFQRTKVITNGGATDSNGRVGVINKGSIDIDEVTEAPESGYIQDTRAWGNIRNDAISGWYNYRTRTHNIESQKNVYIVRTAEGQYMKIKILNYYCKQDESACATMMCGREEAACLTIEYVFAPDGQRFFPSTPALPQADNKLAQNLN